MSHRRRAVLMAIFMVAVISSFALGVQVGAEQPALAPATLIP